MLYICPLSVDRYISQYALSEEFVNMKINSVELYTLSIAASPQEIGSGPLADPILPIAFPFHTAPPPTVICPQVETGSLVGAMVGACIGTALLYTVILLVLICVIFYWNRRHR